MVTKFRMSELTQEERKVLGSQTGVLVKPAITRALKGKHGAAILLSQFLYRAMKGLYEDRDGWFFNTGTQIEQQTGLSIEAQQTARATLIRLGYIEASKRHQGNRYHYRVDLAAVALLFIKDAQASRNGATASESPNFPDSRPSDLPSLELGDLPDQNQGTLGASLDESQVLSNKIKDKNYLESLDSEIKTDGAAAPTHKLNKSEIESKLSTVNAASGTMMSDHQAQTNPSLAAREWLRKHTSISFANWKKDGNYKASDEHVIEWHKTLSDEYIDLAWKLSKHENYSWFKFIDWMNGEHNPPEELRQIRIRLYGKERAAEAAEAAASPTFESGDVIQWSGDPKIEFEVIQAHRNKVVHVLDVLALTHVAGAEPAKYEHRRVEASECTLVRKAITPSKENMAPLRRPRKYARKEPT